MQDPTMLEKATMLSPSSTPTAEEPEIHTKQLSQMQLTWIRFRRHKPAMVGAVILLLMLLMAIFAPLVTPESPYNQFSYDFTNANLSPRLSPHWWFILGTDTDGHTMVSQIAWGARTSLAIGFICSFLVAVIGVLVGSVAGYYGHWVDTAMMRVTDVFLTLPFLPLLLLAADLWGAGHFWIIVLIIVAFNWPAVARLARASYLSLREQEFTEAARAVGVSDARIIFRHILPNALRPIIVQTTLNIAAFIVLEAAIDYLNAGLQYPDASWGNILANTQQSFGSGNWWWPTFPGVALVLTVLAVNFLGDGLGDALDVRSRL